MKQALIADIGGTNVRFGLVDEAGLHDLRYYECKDYAGSAEAARHYLKSLDQEAHPVLGVFAIAAPVTGGVISFTNSPWIFDVHQVQKDLQFISLVVVNDFEAVALSIPGIDRDLLRKIGGDREPVPHAPIGVIGPGTGLGVAYLTWDGAKYRAYPGEGGHVTMPAANEREFEIFHQLHNKYRHISAERVCSGKGLINLYTAISELEGRTPQDIDAATISERGMKGQCPVCEEAITLMLSFLGRVAGNLALTLNAQGGIYIAGGIPAKLGEYFFQSAFLDQFQSKGRMSGFVRNIPSYLIVHDAIGLIGLQRRAEELLRG